METEPIRQYKDENKKMVGSLTAIIRRLCLFCFAVESDTTRLKMQDYSVLVVFVSGR